MGVSRYYRWTVVTLLVVGCAAASANPKPPSIIIHVPHGATCYLKADEGRDRQLLVCACEGECWEQSR